MHSYETIEVGPMDMRDFENVPLEPVLYGSPVLQPRRSGHAVRVDEDGVTSYVAPSKLGSDQLWERLGCRRSENLQIHRSCHSCGEPFLVAEFPAPPRCSFCG